MAENRAIGCNNQLPWRLPADLRHFRALTIGKPVIMGRKTFESLGRPLPDRHNIVLTENLDCPAAGCTLAHSIAEALAAAGSAPEIMVIGGAVVYARFLPLADRMYLTRVHGCFEGDAVFPEFSISDWRECERSDYPPDDKNPFAYSFLTLRRHSKERCSL